MFTTAGFRVLARSTQLGAGTVGLGLTATVRSLHSGVGGLGNPRGGARRPMGARAGSGSPPPARRPQGGVGVRVNPGGGAGPTRAAPAAPPTAAAAARY